MRMLSSLGWELKMLNLGTFLFRYKVLLVTLTHSCVNVLEIMLTFPCPNNVKARIIESNGCSLTLLRMMWYFLVFIMATVVVCDDSQTFEGEGVSLATRINFGDSLCLLDFAKLEELCRRFEVLGGTLLPCRDSKFQPLFCYSGWFCKCHC
ncbi:hypothetical protein Ddye_016002 [Dipteronia dyeriana]|uniref:Uncharacterized protein n=1 Tax=Dipteronia dyeriana TaxID=168575 RepID=A0AAD9WZP4_9ROSI|nr:hypothetical protein Ddye_016002 [Dipteronia dyeriana]